VVRPRLGVLLMSIAPTDDLLNAAELAERLGVKPGTVLAWHRDGRIPSRKLTRKVLRFNLPEVLAALDARQGDGGRGVAR
jgi:excisionase family DNA binding protein